MALLLGGPAHGRELGLDSPVIEVPFRDVDDPVDGVAFGRALYRCEVVHLGTANDDETTQTVRTYRVWLWDRFERTPGTAAMFAREIMARAVPEHVEHDVPLEQIPVEARRIGGTS